MQGRGVDALVHVRAVGPKAAGGRRSAGAPARPAARSRRALPVRAGVEHTRGTAARHTFEQVCAARGLRSRALSRSAAAFARLLRSYADTGPAIRALQ